MTSGSAPRQARYCAIRSAAAASVGLGDGVGMAVAGEEGREAQHVGVVGLADDQRPAVAALDQRDAAQDQRPGDPLAERRLGDEQRPEPGGRDQERLDRALGVAVDQRRPSGELAGLGEELAGALLDQRLAPAEAVAQA